MVKSNFTQSHSGRWHCVKRTLPECGNYDLESYFPVFLWKQALAKEKKNFFWELLVLLQKNPNDFCSNGEEEEEGNEDQNGVCINYFQISIFHKNIKVEDGTETTNKKQKVTKITQDKVPCIYCGKQFVGDRGVKVHMKRCPEK